MVNAAARPEQQPESDINKSFWQAVLTYKMTWTELDTGEGYSREELAKKELAAAFWVPLDIK